MKLDTNTWKWFQIGELFDRFEAGKGHDTLLDDGDDCLYLGAKKSDNGVMRTCAANESMLQKGNCIVFICNGAGSVGCANYMDKPFIATTDLVLGYAEWLNQKTGLFVATVLCKERFKYSFGRKWKTHVRSTEIKLPAAIDGKPDWRWMESYIDSLHSKSLTTGNVKGSNSCSLAIDSWKEFCIGDLFDVVYGVNLELVNCSETDKSTPNAVAFVSRTESNNGVSAYVKPVPGVEPQPKNTITVAGGGSVLATFLQPQPFYSGRDLYLLYPKEDISIYAKLFLVTVIKANKYRYNYGRQANVTLSSLKLRLPSKADGKPNWKFMEEYIKSLPYGDKL